MRNVSTGKAALFLLGVLGVILVVRESGAKADPKTPPKNPANPNDPGAGNPNLPPETPGDPAGTPLGGPPIAGPAAVATVADVAWVDARLDLMQVLLLEVPAEGVRQLLIQLSGRQGALLTGYIVGYEAIGPGGMRAPTEILQVFPPVAAPPFSAEYVRRVDRNGKQISPLP